MSTWDRRALIRTGALAAAAATLGACGGRSTSSGSGGGSNGKDKKVVRIGYINWDEDVVTTYLWKKVLSDKGYTVQLSQLDAAPLYAGMAGGSVDLFMDGWLPTTHADYWKKYGPKLEDVGVWYDNATLAIAVPKYVTGVNSLADLKAHASEFDGKIYGIEPSAGEMRLAKQDVLPAYGLNGSIEVVDSSTPAMLAQLKKSIQAHKPIAVTLWHPHWAYSAFPLKDLADPKKKFGTGEKIHIIARKGFADDFPTLNGWLKSFRMNDTQLGTLEDTVLNQYGTGKEDDGVAAWAKKNASFVSGLTS